MSYPNDHPYVSRKKTRVGTDLSSPIPCAFHTFGTFQSHTTERKFWILMASYPLYHKRNWSSFHVHTNLEYNLLNCTLRRPSTMHRNVNRVKKRLSSSVNDELTHLVRDTWELRFQLEYTSVDCIPIAYTQSYHCYSRRDVVSKREEVAKGTTCCISAVWNCLLTNWTAESVQPIAYISSG